MPAQINLEALVQLLASTEDTTLQMSFIPWRNRKPYVQQLGSQIIVPRRIDIEVTGLATSLLLETTDGTWCWKVTVASQNPFVSFERYIIPPASGLIDWADVPTVDPYTLEQSDSAQAAWDLTLAAVTAQVAVASSFVQQTVDAAEDAENSRLGALNYRTQARDFALEAEAWADDSDGYRDLSATAAGVASQAAVDATAAKNAAQVIKDSINNNIGLPNGIAPLDSAGRLPASLLPLSALEYKGTWNASTNVPTLTDASGSLGDMYRVTTAASRNLGSGTIAFAVSDYVIHNGTIWEKVDTTDAVTTVAGRSGAVVLTKTDVGLANVDNTSDANKPVSGPQQTVLNGMVNGQTLVGDVLYYTTLGGSQVIVGNVRGSQGIQGTKGDIGSVVQLGSIAGTLDLSTRSVTDIIHINLTGNLTISALPPIDAARGGTLTIVLVSNSYAVTWPALFASYGIKPPVTAGATPDIFHLFSDGVRWWITGAAASGALIA